jgi:ribonuclease J
VKAFPLVINDGDILEFKAEAPPQVVGRIPAGRVAVDGKLMGDEDDVQIRDRKKLAATGVVVAFIVMNRFDGSISNGPSLLQHGFLADVEASEELMLEAEEFAREHILSLNEKVRTDLSEVAEAMRVAVRRYFKRKLERKPVVIPIVHEL